VTATPIPSTVQKWPRVQLGSLHAHAVTFDEAVDHILDLAERGLGGYIVTPNVDHVCVAATNPAFANAHRSADLSTVDGMPLLWLARACRTPLPEKIAGSDLLLPVIRRAAERNLRIAFFGGSPEVSTAAAAVISAQIAEVNIVSRVTPLFDPGSMTDELCEAIRETKEARPDLIFVAMGTPNQELFMHQFRAEFEPSVLIGIGAGIDFVAGSKPRAPRWVSKMGLEWLFRLAQEPGRMWRRYLVRDAAIVGIAARQIITSRRRS
jgi:N-acetylglucosaminyldiphosphoundecaprenol N-acetyl-beta-D-mannosaminyltransferase